MSEGHLRCVHQAMQSAHVGFGILALLKSF
ncbi:hypothetical protein PAM7971_01350 [Pacificibacter marinus]|uniref:Uncharacterized protein n=1 Tax=Pacificibacter marinus TaxID=658057 RepID=A0A1Y5S599_9RHOB|nr:hypothetical protein PAM7971_01350 [Pacificibacter marinus]